MTRRAPNAWTCFGVLALVALVFAAFGPGVTDSHLRLDDWGYVYGCPFVKGGVSWKNLERALSTFGYGGIWMPLTSLTYMLDLSLFGGGWKTHHLVNVVLHAANALLVWSFFLALARRGLCRRDFPAAPEVQSKRTDWTAVACWIAALLWAVHPQRAEAVAWVASRKEELWSFFALLAAHAWIRLPVRGESARKPLNGFGLQVLAFAALVAACLSKPTAVCLPFLLLLVERLLGSHDGQSRGGGFLASAIRKIRSVHWLRYLPMAPVVLVTGLVAVHSQTHPIGAAEIVLGDTTVLWRILNAAVSVGLYLLHLVWPVGLHIDCRAVFGGWPLNGVAGLLALAVALAMSVPFLRGRGRPRPAVPFALLWFLVGLLPVLGLLGVTGDKAYAERYTYLPTVALFLLLVPPLVRVATSRGRVAAAVVLCALLAGETVLTRDLVRSFRDDRSAYARVLARDPDHWRALRVLGGEACAREGRTDEGIAMLRRSLALRPSRLTADTLAYVLACRGVMGDFAEVRQLGREALANPRCDRGGLLLDALAIAAMREGDDRTAAKLYAQALVAPARSHSNHNSLLNLGYALANLGEDERAIAVFMKLRNVPEAEIRRRATAAVVRIRADIRRTRFAWCP